ncbi:MAG: squalene synthase HpnC [Dehalococcoidia bacterium]
MLVQGQVRSPTLDEAFAYCQQVARGHYENFTVGSWMLPPALRRHMYAIYAYSRGVDDLGDEAEGDRLALLDEWEAELERCYEGRPQDIRFVALGETIRRFDLPREPFLRLIEANRRDQTVTRYRSFAELEEYCTYSANPVGHLVLYLFGCADAERMAMSDAITTALQLTNFWQDVAVDLEMGRVYIPLEEMERFGYSEEELVERRYNEAFRSLMAFQVDRTRGLFRKGRRLPQLVMGRLRADLRLFSMGGLAVLDAIERIRYDVLHQRPRLSPARKGWLVARALLPELSLLRGRNGG